MSALRRRVEQLYRDGHAAEPSSLWVDPRLTGDEEMKPAAVLVAMTEREQPGLLLIHRPSNMRAHPGQIAFPGGRIDPGESPVEAALREAWEELGIHERDVTIIGPSDLYRTGSGYEVTPILAVVPPDLELNPNPTEVAQWFEAPVDHVLDPNNQHQRWMDWEGTSHTFIEIAWQNHVIWGVTAAIISNLTRRLNWHG